MNHVNLLAPLSLALALSSALATPTPLRVTATDKGYAAPTRLQAGYVTVTFKNSGKMPVDLGFFRLKPGVTEAHFRAAGTAVATSSVKDASFRLNQLVDAVGGVGDQQPGRSDSATLHLLPETYLMASLDADEKTHKTALSMGYLKAITVTGPEVSNAPAAADYTIKMVDYRFELPTNAAAGVHTWQVSNAGEEPHFALLAKILPGKTMKDVIAALMSNDQSAPPPVDFQHSSYAQVVTAGQTETVRRNLSKGSYAVVCFVMSEDGVPHAVMGMAQELVVK
ncbi:hypothetical protein [Deinococcus sp. UYEF24]